jgi:hypothetical protein
MPSVCGLQPLVETVLAGGSGLQALWAKELGGRRLSGRRGRRRKFMLNVLDLLSLMRLWAEDFIRYSEQFSTSPAFDALSSIPSRGPYPGARQA